jgi:hypothetical protein
MQGSVFMNSKYAIMIFEVFKIKFQSVNTTHAERILQLVFRLKNTIGVRV